MKRMAYLLAIFIIVSCLYFAVELRVVEPVRFQYVNALHDGDWYWCKTKGSKLIWHWEPINNLTNRFYITYTLLQTDGTGKSGVSSERIKVIIVAEVPEGSCRKVCYYYDTAYHTCIKWREVCPTGKKFYYRKIAESILKMINPFRPTEKRGDSSTYISYGYAEFYVPPSKIKYLRNGSFRVIIQWPPLSDRYYFAGSPDEPPLIIFTK